MRTIHPKLVSAVAIAAAVLGTGGLVVTQALAKSAPGRAVVRPVLNSSSQAPSVPPAVAPPAATDDERFAQKFRIRWESISLTSTHANPDNPNARGRADSQALSIQGNITVLDPANVLGFERMNALKVTRLVDEAGHDVTATAQPGGPPQRWYAPLFYSQKFDNQANRWADELQPQRFDATLSVTARLPKRFARVEGVLRVLTCDRIEDVDVPYIVNGPPVAVLPGTHVHFATATHDANSYSYQLVSDDPPGPQPFDGLLRNGQPLPDRMIAAKYLVDAAGKPINTTTRPFGNFAIGTNENGSGGGRGADKITAMRFEIAVGLREREVPVTLKDIDLPRPAAVGDAAPAK